MTNETQYWTPEVEEALAKYVTCVDSNEKNVIFNKYLHEPFKKLIDVTIKRYRPDVQTVTDEMISDLLYSLIIHVQRFNPDKVLSNGMKISGHSYCSVIIRSAIAHERCETAKKKRIFIEDEKGLSDDN